MRKIIILLNEFYESCIRNISGPLGQRLRYNYYKKRLGKCGENVKFDIGIIIQGKKDIFIENNVWIDNNVILLAGKPSGNRKMQIKDNSRYIGKLGELHIKSGVHIAPFCVIQSHGGIYIGNHVGIASGSKVYSLSHHYRNTMDREDKTTFFFTPMVKDDCQFLIASPVVIEDNTAIGLNSTVLPGTVIPKGTWIGVNSFVGGKNLESDSIYSSSSADFIKKKA